MNSIRRTAATASALLVLTVVGSGAAHAQRPVEPAKAKSGSTASVCSAHPYSYDCWQGPRRPDGGPAYRIVTGISPL